MQITYNITVPCIGTPGYTENGLTVTMTAEQITKFHDELTEFYNNNYQALTKDKD